MLYSYLDDTAIQKLIQVYICPSSITCVNSMEVSYIPIAKARGFMTHLDKYIIQWQIFILVKRIKTALTAKSR